MSAVGGTSEVLSVVFSLLIIMAFLFAAACLARRWRVGGRLRGPRGGAQPMGWQSSLHIVEAEGQRFLIAASRSGIAAIGRLDAQGPDFADLLDGPGGRDAHSRSKP
jgi:hypothetical protein